MSEKLEKQLKSLKLSGIIKNWQSIIYKNNEQFLTDLFDSELQEREANRINRFIKTANFPVIKELNKFIWSKNIDIPVSISQDEIEQLNFLEKKENLIFLGSVGTGKTHLATALAFKGCHYGKQVRFFTAASLSNLLIDKSQKGQLNSFITSLKRLEMIVIDEVGFVPLHKDAAELLFQVISDCYERKSLIVTSNLEFSQWNTIFGDNRLTAALIDRLIHHSHILVFSGESFRLTESMKKVRSS